MPDCKRKMQSGGTRQKKTEKSAFFRFFPLDKPGVWCYNRDIKAMTERVTVFSARTERRATLRARYGYATVKTTPEPRAISAAVFPALRGRICRNP